MAGLYWPLALPQLGYALLASLCVYHGSMALNDWHDLNTDVAAGRNRPLTTGAIRPMHALFLGAALVLGGVSIPYFAPAIFGLSKGVSHLEFLLVAALATGYSFGLRGPLLGPALLGLCRAGNFVFGALVVAANSGLHIWPAVPLAATIYFALVFTVSSLGRYEDGEAAATPEQLAVIAPRLLRRQVGLLWSLPLALCALRYWQPTLTQNTTQSGTLLVACLAIGCSLAIHYSLPLLKLSKSTGWTPAKIEAVMGLCLSRFVPFAILSVVVTIYSWHGLLAAAGLHLLAKVGRRMMAFIPPS